MARLQPGHRAHRRARGRTPITIQAAEVTQALATGAIDSMMTSGATGYDTKVYETVKNFYDTQAWLPKNVVIVSQKAFDALDKSDAGRGAQGRRSRRDARLENQRGKNQLVPRPAAGRTA